MRKCNSPKPNSSYLKEVLDYFGITEDQAGMALERILGDDIVREIRSKKWQAGKNRKRGKKYVAIQKEGSKRNIRNSPNGSNAASRRNPENA